MAVCGGDMNDDIAEIVITAFSIDLGLGIIFGILFAFIGWGRVIDTTLKTASTQARLLIFFGALALWPYLLYRVMMFKKSWAIRRRDDEFDHDAYQRKGDVL